MLNVYYVPGTVQSKSKQKTENQGHNAHQGILQTQGEMPIKLLYYFMFSGHQLHGRLCWAPQTHIRTINYLHIL